MNASSSHSVIWITEHNQHVNHLFGLLDNEKSMKGKGVCNRLIRDTSRNVIVLTR